MPSEAEWEFAARGGNKSKWFRYSGSNDYDEVAWCYENDKSRVLDHNVKEKKPNELGLYDMSGLEYEWCLDCFGKYKAKSQSDPFNCKTFDKRFNDKTKESLAKAHNILDYDKILGPDNRRVQRGGCWRHSARGTRVSARLPEYQRQGGQSAAGLRLVLPAADLIG